MSFTHTIIYFYSFHKQITRSSFLKDISSISSVNMLVESFKEFYCFFGLKISTAKCEIAGLIPLNASKLLT